MTFGRAQGAWLLLAAAVLYLCLFDGLGSIGLIGPDEPRYAAIAREMAETDDWVTPRLQGKPWFEKPILYYWAAAIQYKLWGDSEFSARVPSALAALVTTLTLGWLAWRCYSLSAAAIVVVLFPTTVAAIGFGRAATMDMLFSMSLVLAMATAARIIRPGRGPANFEETAYAGAKTRPQYPILVGQLGRCGFGAALGLAALAKGPAAIVLAGGSVGLWAIATRRWREALPLLHPLALLSFAVVALPWYVLCALRNPEFIDVFLISHNVQRFTTPVFQHQQPFWFFVPVLLLALFPWTVLLARTVSDGVVLARSGNWRGSSSFFVACWAVWPVLFFSFSQSKLPGYILPAVPAFALLLARTVSKLADEDVAVACRWLAGIAGTILLLGIAFLFPQTTVRLPEAEPLVFRSVAILAGTGGAVSLYLVTRKKLWFAVGTVAATLASLCFVITHTLLPQMESQRSARTAALVLKSQPTSTVGRVEVYKLHRAWHYGLNYYLREELREWDPEKPDDAYVVTSEAGLRDLTAKRIPMQLLARISPQAVILACVMHVCTPSERGEPAKPTPK